MGRLDVLLPSGLSCQRKCGWLADGALQGGRHRRDVPTPVHVRKGVTVEKPARLRQRSGGMYAARAAHRSAADAGKGGGLRGEGYSRYGVVNGGARAGR